MPNVARIVPSRFNLLDNFLNYMRLRKIEVLSFILVLATFVAGALIYPAMPERIASHWGASGQVNGHMGKFWGTFLLPIIMFFCALLFMVVPRIDPKKENIQKFEKYYDLFILAFLFFFIYIYALTIFFNLGYQFNLTQFMAPALAVLFYAVGIMVAHAEPNWTIGIRTPWTLSSDDVWRKTHKLGGKLFQAVAFICLLGIFIPRYTILFVALPVIAVAIYLFLYSYLEFKKLKV
jgi:uncharacterized membrane protein